MDGEHGIGDPTWPAARSGRRAPAGPGADIDPDATHAYPGSLGGRGGPATGGRGSPGGAARVGTEPAATQLFDGVTGSGPGGGPGGSGGSPPTTPATRSNSDTVAFRTSVGAGYPGPGPEGAGPAGGPRAHGQDRFGPGGSARGGSGGPSRRVVLTSLGVAALLAVGAGTVYSMTRSRTGSTTVTPTVSTAATTPSATSTSPKAAAAPSVTVTVTTTARATGASGAPGGYVEEPWSDPDMDFGTIVAVKEQGDKARITVRRQHFLTGDAAREYYDDHPNKERMDYAITDDGGKNKHYTVAEDALVYGSNLLGDGPNSHSRLTVSAFTTKAGALLDDDTPLRMWMSRRSSSSNTVVYLAEQYVP